MKYKVQPTFNEETKNGILRAVNIAERAVADALIEHVRFSKDEDQTLKLAEDVRQVQLAYSILGYGSLSYEIIEE